MRTITRALQQVKIPTFDHGHIILYDIPTANGPVPWSPNVWRTRLALNFKKIPYKTKWVEYPDIENTAKHIGAKPTGFKPDKSGDMFWTCPIIIDPSHAHRGGKPTVLSDSYNIAKYLDKVYPKHELFPDGTLALQRAWAHFVSQSVIKPLANLMLPLYQTALSPRSAEYIKATREVWYMPLSEMSPDRPRAWSVVREGLDKIAMAFDENGKSDGQNLRVIPGRTCYADFALLGPLLWVVALAPKEESDLLKTWNGGRWGKLLGSFADIVKDGELQ